MKQRSDKWKKYRGTRITASNFGDVLADPATKRYQSYQQDIIDCIMGVPNFDVEKPWFQHGIEWEPEAVGRYEWETNTDVKEVGIIEHPKYSFISCSPDGLVGLSGGLEVKCRKSFNEHLVCVRRGMPSNHRPQVQGCLWISGRKWWDFVSYFKNNNTTEINIARIEPDLEYHKRLESACLKFWNEITSQVRFAKENILKDGK